MVWLVLASATASRAEFRDFMNSSGQVIRAELVSHKKGRVKLRREDGKEFECAPGIFCPVDAAFIKEWMAKTPEKISYRFHIVADAKKMAGETHNLGYKLVKNDKWSYVIAISNLSRDTVKDFTVKYRVFYTDRAQGEYSSGSYNESIDQMLEKEVKIDQEVKYNRTAYVTTEPVSIDIVDYDGAGDRYKDELKGCMVRLVDPQGEVIKDYVSSETAMRGKTWENTSMVHAHEERVLEERVLVE